MNPASEPEMPSRGVLAVIGVSGLPPKMYETGAYVRQARPPPARTARWIALRRP